MNQAFSLPTALCLPSSDITALLQGRIIAALPRMFIRPGQRFALYPAETPGKIKAWAKCELCQILDGTQPLEVLSQLTIWTPEKLKDILQKQQHIFLAYLRVYQLPHLQEIVVTVNFQEKIGKFISLPNSLTGSESTPVLTDAIFAQRKRQLEKLEPPLHHELEELQSAVKTFATSNPIAKQLDQDITNFLGWSTQKVTVNTDSDLHWIKTIADVGNSSDGDTFEKLVRQSLIKLGFSNKNKNPKASLDPNSTGGAGGLDFYCEAPYSVVGECKATKTEKVPDGTAAQLIKLGYKHLQKQYNLCIKIIMAAGELTEDANLTASGNKMNVIRPETLQRLVELKVAHPGSINLLELKPCLEQKPFGEAADDKVNNYIDKIEQNIKLRSHIIQVLKNYLELTNYKRAGVEALHAAYVTSNPPQPSLNSKAMHEILIELSSPLTGYLGREKGDNWRSDRFYFLRDLPIN